MTIPIQPPVESTETTQAVVEQPVPTDRVVHDYGSAWLLYTMVACAFLLVLYRLIRRWPKWLLVPVWSLFAAGALTPANSTPDGPWLAPAAIVGILGAEQDGVTGLMRGAAPIAINFLIISGLLSLLFFALSRRPKPVTSNQTTETAAAADSDTETEAEPERQEPKL